MRDPIELDGQCTGCGSAVRFAFAWPDPGVVPSEASWSCPVCQTHNAVAAIGRVLWVVPRDAKPSA